MPNSENEETAAIKERLLALEDQLLVASRLTQRMNRLAERDELTDRRIADLVSACGCSIRPY